RERTQELSVQMALGAKRRDLCSLVLIEMMITTMIGGLLGIILAVGAAEPFSKSTDLQMLIDGGVLISATMIGLAIGLFSSISSLWLVINISPSESFRQ
ncbi:MAG: FtsX-like permease family protein, partial [Rickettsiales bacterium]|nr:FtsX-like permease family protein [Rickettsiales bacterium]